MSNENSKSENVQFVDITSFKELIGKSNHAGEILKNPKTGKVFVVIGDKTFKAQGDINTSKPMKFLIEGGDYAEACLVNVAQVNTLGTI